MTDIFDARLARRIQYDRQRHYKVEAVRDRPDPQQYPDAGRYRGGGYLDRYEDPALVRSRLLESQRLASQVALSKPLLQKQKKRKKKVSKKIKL